MNWVESAEAIGEVDELLASVGLGHGRRKTLAGTWQGGERREKGKETGGGLPISDGRDVGHPLSLPSVVRAAGWERYAWLRHGFSAQAGGVSEIYSQSEGEGSLNLGFTKEDEAANVVENRRRFLAEVTRFPASPTPEKQDMGHPVRLVTLRQVHSGMVRVIGPAGVEDGEVSPTSQNRDARHPSWERQGVGLARLETADGRAALRGDGLMTDVPGVMLGVQVADCVPVLVADVRRRAVAAFHAGWRGTLARIVERGIGRMRLRYGSRPEDLVAVVGPAIGACCYSVGEEVRHEFESQFAYAPELFSEVYDSDPVRDKYPLLFLTARAPGHSNIGPQIHLDLWEANRRQLLDAGVKEKRITVVGECTACARMGAGTGLGGLKYFSHRGESGFAGRMMAVVGVEG
jgi:YfiH family protein